MKKLLIALSIIALMSSTCLAYEGISGRMTSGRKTITTAGTAEQIISSALSIQKVIITAETDNTGIIVVGDSGVVASLSTRKGIPLSAGQSITLLLSDLSKVWLDTTVNGDGVTYLYFMQ